jgi:hypothetical protein
MPWITAELEFASFFSYRVPGSSPSFALASPAPSPGAVRLGLTATMIEASGHLTEGERFFDVVKSAPLRIQVPERASAFRALVRRLKKEKNDRNLIQSYGTREYVHFHGPLTVSIDVENGQVEKVRWVLTHLRRLGTTDSLLFCKGISNTPLDERLCIRPLAEVEPRASDLNHRLVLPLIDLADKPLVFEDVNIYSGSTRKGALKQMMYLFPLKPVQIGDTWVIYERSPFEN